ncbi:MAG: hypothetical protein RBR03_09085 [Desulfuromonas thiophila]|jgi:hypothetical protein|nr:DUF1353 domain-containing protein [Desulfuromonas thiophila]MDY0398799.1 hypothetical protein [Desulfuromonas thiophila]
MGQGSIHYRDGYRYQLAERYQLQTELRPLDRLLTPFVELDCTGLLTIHAGYAWDGATLCPDFPWILRGSLVHDALYQLIRLRLLPVAAKDTADALLHQHCLEDGASRFAAWLVWQAVQRFGHFGTDPLRRRPVLIAPEAP